MTGIRAPYRLSDRYAGERGTVFLTGIQALARIPFDQLRVDRRAGLDTAAFVSGYPGSPLGGFDRAVRDSPAKHAPELPVVTRPAMNEEYAATAVMGSQLARRSPGLAAMTGWSVSGTARPRVSTAPPTRCVTPAFAGTWSRRWRDRARR